jgi:ribonuclease P protein component
MKNLEIQKVYKKGTSHANRYLVMYVLENQRTENRLGISVSKKIGNSVVRHRITRLIREGFRLNKERLKTGNDIVVIARIPAKGQSYHELESALIHLFIRHHLMENRKNDEKASY